MQRIPMSWIERIFDRMGQYFGDTWNAQMKSQTRRDMMMTQWQNGLHGLTDAEIRNALDICRELGDMDRCPPWVMEFYAYAKGARTIHAMPLQRREVG